MYVGQFYLEEHREGMEARRSRLQRLKRSLTGRGNASLAHLPHWTDRLPMEEQNKLLTIRARVFWCTEPFLSSPTLGGFYTPSQSR